MKNACRRSAFLLALLIWIASAELAPAEEIRVRGAYLSIILPEPVQTDFPYDDAWFSEDPTVYNHSLACASLGMALSAYRDITLDLSVRDQHAIDFLRDAGFEDIRSYQFDVVPAEDTIASLLAYKKMDGFTLIVSPVSGGYYENEWLSNLNVGNEVRHVGFNAAAQVVEERIRAYIEEHSFEEPLKLWCSGYSRSAAVSSLVAADMTDSGIFADVFAYVYAPPRSTREPGDYRNIFCIIGKYDPIPTVPLWEWGYRHIGVELYTPSQECDSDYAQLVPSADEVSRALFAVPFRNNPSMNYDLRTVLNYLLDLLPDAADYHTLLFPELRAVWVEEDEAQLVQTLAAALRRVIPKDERQKALLADFINYLTTLVYHRTAGADAADFMDGSWDRTSTLEDNIVHEHSPDVYVSWMLSTDNPEEILTESGETSRLCVNGEVTLDIYDEFGFVQRVDHHGEISFDPPEDVVSLRQVKDCPNLHSVRQGSQTIVSIPRDRYYAVVVRSEEAQDVSYFATEYNMDQLSGKTTQKYDLRMDAGEEYCIVCFPAESGKETLSGVDEAGGEAQGTGLTYSPSLTLAMEKSNMLEMNLSTLLVLIWVIFYAVCLIAILTIVFGIIRLIRKKKRNAAVTIITHALVALLLFVLEEGARYYMQGLPVLMTVLKGLISLTVALLCLKGVRVGHRRSDICLCVGLFVAGAADVMMNRIMPVATLLFAAAHVLFSTGFVIEKRPRVWQVIVWAALSALFTAVIWHFRSYSPMPLGFVIFYALILSAMVALSLRMRACVIVGTLLFAASVILLSGNVILGETRFSHMCSLGLFYISELIIASSVWLGRKKPE